MNRYQYDPITQGADIRLLRILAGSSGDIVCELTPIAFGSTGYLALSYVWGSYEPLPTMRRILIQESAGERRAHRFMAVRRNLYSLLEQLRHPTNDVECWADAICIDQQNGEEKSLQLALMQDIYRKAERVVFWLGSQEDYTLDAFKCVRILRQADFREHLAPEYYPQLRCFRQLLANVWFRRRWIVQEVAFSRVAVLFSGPCSVYWSVFTEAARTYFTHQALIQTVALEERSPSHYYDTSIQAAKVLIEFTCSFSKDSISKPWGKRQGLQTGLRMEEDAQPEARNTADMSEDVRKMIEDYEGGQTKEYRLTLEKLVDVFKTHEVSDYRDTIYAVLSLAKDTTTQHRQSSGTELLTDSISSLKEFPKFRPDYKKDVFEVFKDYTQYCTERQTAYPIDILCRGWVPRSIENMYSSSGSPNEPRRIPHGFEALSVHKMAWIYERVLASWMPMTGNPGFNYIQSQNMQQSLFVGLPDHPIYNASKGVADEISFGATEHVPYSKHIIEDQKPGTHAKVPRKISDGTLSVKGIRLDTIEMLSSCYENVITKDWLLIGGWSGKRSWWGRQPVPDAFWRTMIANRDLAAAGPTKPEFRKACKKLLGYRDEHDDIHTNALINLSDYMLVRYLNRVRQVASGRRLFRTKIRKRLGLAPANVMQEDIVCLLYGCSVPVILRAQPQEGGNSREEYRLIGECYLDGMMEGEAVSNLRLRQARKDGSEQIFVLR